MSRFNLNENNEGVKVFNNGIAGKVENVSVTVEKRKLDEPDSYPDYKLIVDDHSGAQPINQGFYIDPTAPEAKQDQTIQRVKSIANAVVPEDYVFPEVNSYEEALNTLFKVIKENSDGKKVDVFTTYGYSEKPSKFLGLRMFNFIQKPGAKFDRLKPQAKDVLERPMADNDNSGAQGGDQPKVNPVF